MPVTAQLPPPTADRIVARARAYLAIGAVVGAEGPLLRGIAAELSAGGCPARLGDGVLDDYHTNHEATTAQAVDAAARVLTAALPGAARHALG